MLKTCYHQVEHLVVSRVHLKGNSEAIIPYRGRTKQRHLSLSGGKGLGGQLGGVPPCQDGSLQVPQSEARIPLGSSRSSGHCHLLISLSLPFFHRLPDSLLFPPLSRAFCLRGDPWAGHLTQPCPSLGSQSVLLPEAKGTLKESARLLLSISRPTGASHRAQRPQPASPARPQPVPFASSPVRSCVLPSPKQHLSPDTRLSLSGLLPCLVLLGSPHHLNSNFGC